MSSCSRWKPSNFVQIEHNSSRFFEFQEMRPNDPVSIQEMMIKNYSFFGSAGVKEIMKKMEFGERFLKFFIFFS